MLPSVADDMEKRHVWLQLAAGGEVSRATAYRAFNIDNPVPRSNEALRKIWKSKRPGRKLARTLSAK